jgi:hypothetical protein
MERRLWKIPIGRLQGDSDFPFGVFFYLVPEKQEILSFVKKFSMKRKGMALWIPELIFRAGGDF